MLVDSQLGKAGMVRSGWAQLCRSGCRVSFVPSLTDKRKKGKFVAKARPGISLGLVLQRGHAWKQDCWM
eukprot:15453704-Alexandrium_andersonii.AAC.1